MGSSQSVQSVVKDYGKEIQDAANATQDRLLNKNGNHQDYAERFAAELSARGISYTEEEELKLANGFIGKPDFTIYRNGRPYFHIEIKAKEHFIKPDIDQATAYKEASRHDFAYIINFGKVGKPNIRIIQ